MTNTTFKIRSILSSSSSTLRKRHLGYKHSTSKAGLWHRNFVSMPISPSLSYRIRKLKKIIHKILVKKGFKPYEAINYSEY